MLKRFYSDRELEYLAENLNVFGFDVQRFENEPLQITISAPSEVRWTTKATFESMSSRGLNPIFRLDKVENCVDFLLSLTIHPDLKIATPKSAVYSVRMRPELL